MMIAKISRHCVLSMCFINSAFSGLRQSLETEKLLKNDENCFYILP